MLIVCNANQTADVEIFWTKNDVNSTFRQNGTYLTFVKISRRSAGEYICYSVNKTVGHETESNATVVDIVDVDVQCKFLCLYRTDYFKQTEFQRRFVLVTNEANYLSASHT